MMATGARASAIFMIILEAGINIWMKQEVFVNTVMSHWIGPLFNPVKLSKNILLLNQNILRNKISRKGLYHGLKKTY